MKKLLILLSLILLTKTICSSQTILTETAQDSIVYVTSEQLRYANLIFAEHEKLLTEDSLYKSEIKRLQTNLRIAELTDSLRIEQLDQYEKLNNANYWQIQDLNNNISKKNKTILGLKIGCITVSIGVALLLIFK